MEKGGRPVRGVLFGGRGRRATASSAVRPIRSADVDRHLSTCRSTRGNQNELPKKKQRETQR